MGKFSDRSLVKLEQCHPDIIKLFMEVVTGFDCTVVEGHRDEDRQKELFELGKTQLLWPNSKHNKKPSEGIDMVPYPVDWEDRERFLFFGGYVMGKADSMKIGLRWGGGWDRDTQVRGERVETDSGQPGAKHVVYSDQFIFFWISGRCHCGSR